MAERESNAFSAAEKQALIKALERHDVEPFREIVALFIEGRPTADDVRAFAKKNPAQWMQGLTMAARQAGYSPADITVEFKGIFGLAKRIDSLSDSELEAEYQQRQAKPAKVIPLSLASGRAEGAQA